jgi:phosphoglycerate dehydrogenase-like enzyme
MTAARRIVVTSGGARHQLGVLAALAASGVEVVERLDLGDSTDEDALAAGLAGAWGVVAGGEAYTRAVLGRLPDLRAIVRWGVGYDRVDVAAGSDLGVAVCTVPGANADAVADMALALVLACVRRLRELDAAVREGEWRPPWTGRDLASATVGVVGLGAIGKAVVRRLRGFDCRVLAHEPDPDREFCERHAVELAELPQLLPQVDVLTLHAPLVPATHHLIGARELGLLPPHAVVVNTARGGLIDEAALVGALREGALGGAGLDVFEREPLPPSSPLLALPNVVLTGHASSFTELGARRTAEAVIASFGELLAGRLPAGCLNPEAWAVSRAPAPAAPQVPPD